ncbi:MAG: hypothetical protein J7M26_05290 [Armatimonadetes bacterium]|nr:hypothetical protein [Armatimonadota bacterium]
MTLAFSGLAAAWLILVITPLVPGLPPLAGTVVASALLAFASFAGLYGLAGLKLAAWHEVAGAAAAGGLWYLVGKADAEGLGRIFLPATASCLFLLACAMVGRLLSRLVREPNLLLPVLVTAAVADLFTVTLGPTHTALEKAPQVVRNFSMTVPKAGSAAGEKGVEGLAAAASIGVGDFIFAALFLTAAWRHGLETRRAAMAAAVLAVIAMSAVLLIPALPALPLLPFIVVGVLVPNAGRFRFSPQEKLALAVGVIFLGLLLAAYLLLK